MLHKISEGSFFDENLEIKRSEGYSLLFGRGKRDVVQKKLVSVPSYENIDRLIALVAYLVKHLVTAVYSCSAYLNNDVTNLKLSA